MATGSCSSTTNTANGPAPACAPSFGWDSQWIGRFVYPVRGIDGRPYDFRRGMLPPRLVNASAPTSGRRVRRAHRRAVQAGTANPSSWPPYKTEPCAVALGSTCPFGDACRFAHSSRDLRPTAVELLYKTRPCRQWAERGACSYSDRCRFTHGEWCAAAPDGSDALWWVGPYGLVVEQPPADEARKCDRRSELQRAVNAAVVLERTVGMLFIVPMTAIRAPPRGPIAVPSPRQPHTPPSPIAALPPPATASKSAPRNIN